MRNSELLDDDVNIVVDDLDHNPSRLEHLRHSIEHAAHLLPAQGPIEVFVHHNTLHAFEELHFHAAVKEGNRVYGANPYLPEAQYRQMLETGRITLEDLEFVVSADLGPSADRCVSGMDSLFGLRMCMLRHRFDTGTDAELRWVVAETDALESFREDVPFRIREQMIEGAQKWLESSPSEHAAEVRARITEFSRTPSTKWREKEWEAFVLRYLWRVCRKGVEGLPPRQTQRPDLLRPRDVLLHATGEDIDVYVNELLVRFCSAFLDQGYSDWSLPHRDEGLYNSFISIYGHPLCPPDLWMKGLSRELKALKESQTGPWQSVLDSLELFGIPESRCDDFIAQTLLALGGWAGMVWQMESAADWTVRPAPPGSLLEYLALRLILEHQAILYVGSDRLGCDTSVREVIELAKQRIKPRKLMSDDRRAFQIFQIAQLQGWGPERLVTLTKENWSELVEEVEVPTGIDRRRLFHEAYERQYRVNALDAFANHAKRRRDQTAQAGQKSRPAFQIMCCIDDREESFRRHLEEIDPEVETFGAAGFFAVVMYYRGASEAYYKPLCPVVVTPQHYVTEDVGYTFEGVNRKRAASRQQLGQFTHRVHSGSRSFVGGIFTGLLGSLATAPLVGRVLFPWLTSKIRARFGEFLQPPPVTQLQLERYKSEPGNSNGHIGYTVEEMSGVVERLLQDIGLTKTNDFSRLFIVCGHGSASMNNPHESAYCCGACAGKRGGPNARAFAQMANDWRVRSLLLDRGIVIPKDTFFVGSYHDTTNDSVVWYDLDRMPASHRLEFERAHAAVEKARKRNAHERCRRFASANLSLENNSALRHVETRGQDLSQVRPEYNHATNALCLVGRRDWSRGLFLDRRSFLTSYDPAQDDEESSILFRILAAAIPVCAGINLEYYFSTIDNKHFGSGSKLPHNLVSMLGVMEGANSDLRTGLYQQMIEIHEPMRLMFVVETTPEAMLGIIKRHAGIERLCRGDWVQIAVIHPETSEIQLWQNGEFKPYKASTNRLPVVASSRVWYQNKRVHLDFVSIGETTASTGAMT